MNWKYYYPTFDFDQNIHSTWWGHVWFSYDLIRNMKPKCIVELGTHYGVSFYSMCQAVKDDNIDTELHAVDTWEGDAHAKVGYDKKDVVFESVKKEIVSNFNNLRIELHRETFDDALEHFGNDSIDILHIDGLHTYEAVKHDFEVWEPRVKRNGIIMFHDIHEHKDDFGVYILWEELKKKYRTIEFSHYHGLGVLFKDEFSYELIKDICCGYYELLPGRIDVERKWIQDFESKNRILANENKELHKSIQLMESSRFWKLRNFYIKFKKPFILK